MSTNTPAQAALTQVRKGDVFSLPVLMSFEHAALRDAATALGVPLVVSPGAVTAVLQGLDAGVFPPNLVQSWASFVRRGYIEDPNGGPVQPLNIDYEDAWEDAIVEAVSRMDEIGDIIDGEISSHEVRNMIQLFGEL